jgi:hypothetical protein
LYGSPEEALGPLVVEKTFEPQNDAEDLYLSWKNHLDRVFNQA